MSPFLMSLLREIAQKLVGAVALWLVARGFDVPSELRDQAAVALIAAALVVWTLLVRWLETRRVDTLFGRLAHALARVLMLGIGTKPTYPRPVPDAVREMRAARAEREERLGNHPDALW